MADPGKRGLAGLVVRADETAWQAWRAGREEAAGPRYKTFIDGGTTPTGSLIQGILDRCREELEILDSNRVDHPLSLPVRGVSLLKIPTRNRVAGPRPPVQAGEPLAQRLPERGPEAFALRLGRHRELVQIRQAVENMVAQTGGTLTIGEIPFTSNVGRPPRRSS